MRRLLSILLFAAFLLPLALPLLALGQNADAGLPVCCRREGKHHCAMSMGERLLIARNETKAPAWSAPQERCPYAPASVLSSHPVSFLGAGAQLISADFFSHPSGRIQTECRRRIARDRARQKRGPPAVSLV